MYAKVGTVSEDTLPRRRGLYKSLQSMKQVTKGTLLSKEAYICSLEAWTTDVAIDKEDESMMILLAGDLSSKAPATGQFPMWECMSGALMFRGHNKCLIEYF